MSGDDYLWDRSGVKDDEVERLEDALRPLAAAEPPPLKLSPRAVVVARGAAWRRPLLLAMNMFRTSPARQHAQAVRALSPPRLRRHESAPAGPLGLSRSDASSDTQ